jgi:hypothetical protein
MLLGVETEYAATGFPRAADAQSRGVWGELESGVRHFHAHVRDACGSGIHLGSGARFYLDCTMHPEFCTPECTSPREVLVYLRAGERILHRAARRALERDRTLADIGILRANVDYAGDGTSWGAHESYLHRSAPSKFPDTVVPHLVTRIVYSGAGGFHPVTPGLEFTLSPRAWLMEHEISSRSTDTRGIYHTRDESLSGEGYHRLHVICGETLCSDTSVLLKLGTTALVVAAVDAGWSAGPEACLRAPVTAMHTIARDPTCRADVVLCDGRRTTALDVQRYYWRAMLALTAEGRLPEWSGEICALWGEALDHLEQGSSWVHQHLDWGIKYALYRRWVGEERWNELHHWSRVWRHVGRQFVPVIQSLRMRTPQLSLEAFGDEFEGQREMAARLATHLRHYRRDVTWLLEMISLRHQLFEIDLRFGQLGSGIFDQLQSSGQGAPRLVTDDEIDRAMDHRQRDQGPRGTRRGAGLPGRLDARLAPRRNGNPRPVRPLCHGPRLAPDASGGR